MRRPITLIALLLVAANLAAQPVSPPHITVELVSPAVATAPGKPIRIGLRIELEKDWHIYWRNPGDAGLATTLQVKLPPGFTAGDLKWPFPHLFGDPPEVSYGYEGVIILPITITHPDTIPNGTIVTIGVTASWLVCNDVCIPGKAELSIDVCIDDALAGQRTKYAEEFVRAEGTLPRTARKIDVTALRVGDHYEIIIANNERRKIPLPKSVHFFASEEEVIDHSAKQSTVQRGITLVHTVPVSTFESKAPTHLRGVLVADEAWNGNGLRAITVDAPIAIERTAEPEPARLDPYENSRE